MGGSILGLEALNNFLQHKIKKKIIFFDNLNEIKIKKIVAKNSLKDSLFIIISKSGNTLETLANLTVINTKLTKKNTIIITENKKSALYNYGINKKIKIIEHNKSIGGRFSVLSEVGMVPAFLFGLNINQLRDNLSVLLGRKKNILVESVQQLSKIFLNKKFSSIILLNYSPHLNQLMQWYQQLISESLGKKGKGLMPVSSTAPKDHHSMLQLYLDGPKDKIFYIFSSQNKNSIKIKKNEFGKNYQFLKSSSLQDIIEAQKNAVVKVLKKNKIPFKKIKIKGYTEKNISFIFSYFMLETIILGKLINLNPFDQPAVEQVKVITKRELN